jgi:hypothetical protein
MDEYIARGKFLDYMKGTSRYFNVKFDIENFPAADVAPVVHGRWIGAPLCGNDNCRCSECGSWHNVHANLRGEIIQKYCPNCGAKMDLEETDNG